MGALAFAVHEDEKTRRGRKNGRERGRKGVERERGSGNEEGDARGEAKYRLRPAGLSAGEEVVRAELARDRVRAVVDEGVVLHLEHLRLGRERERWVRVAQEAVQGVREERCDLCLVQYWLHTCACVHVRVCAWI